MTHCTEFEKAVKHMRACLFWDFVDGVWNDVIVTPLDRNYFDRLIQQVSDAHAREVEVLKAENAKLRESLERAAGIIADICGECPVSRYEWLSSDGCAEKCGTVTEEDCWIAYLTGKRWNESEAEVDG